MRRGRLLCKCFECSELWRATDFCGRATVGVTRGMLDATGVAGIAVFGGENEGWVRRCCGVLLLLVIGPL